MPITQISTTGIADGSITASKLDPNSIVIPPTVTQIQITNSSYVVLDDTAVSTSGGYIKITGTGFTATTTVVIGSVTASAVSYVSSTTLNVQVPAQSAGTYTVYVVNTNGSVGIVVNGLNYSGSPTWVTTSPLANGQSGSPISIQLSATGDAPLTYALQAGSTLPSGLTLTSGGLLSGTVTIANNTTYNFTIVASDAQLQDTPQAFAITITSGDSYWSYVTTLLSASTPTTLPFNDDASTNNFAVTIAGDTKPNNFNPYTPGYYSNYFDGTGDYLTAPGITEFAFGIGNWTVEFWVYPLAYGGSIAGAQLFGTTNGATSNYSINLGQDINSFRIVSNATGSWADTLTVSAGGGPELNTWSHMAISRNGANISIYKNGARVATSASAVTWNFTGTTGVIGRFSDGTNTRDYNGYISNLRVVKGSAVYDPTQSTITVPTAPLTAVTNTQLLTCQSNRFIDNSTNNFTITKFGDTTVNSFDPYIPNSSYSTYGSTYFDGTGDYLTVNAITTSGDFTLEFWAYRTTGITSFMIVASNGNNNGWIGWQSNSTTFVWDTVVNATVPDTVNTWAHYAIVKQSGTAKIYVNGVQCGSAATSANLTFSAIGIYNLSNYGFTGYLSDFRLVNGTAVYTSAFTPPTQPLTAVANTSLLTCQTNQPVANNTFLDNSTNNFAITRNGNTTQGTFSPYGGGFSNYFNGSSDWLQAPASTNIDFGTGDYTIEAWINPSTVIATTEMIVSRWSASNGRLWILGINTTGLVWSENANATVVNGTFTFVTNTWYHVAATRQSGTLRLFVNGSQVGSTSSTFSLSSSTVLKIAAYDDNTAQFFPGYISNLRLVKGTALYTTTFTPSTTPLQPIANTGLLTCQSPNFVDNSANNFTITRNGSPTIQKYNPFGGVTLPTPYYGAYFNGSTDYLSTSGNAAFAMSTGNFTYEAWIYPISISTYWQIIGQFSTLTTGVGSFTIPINSSRQIELYYDGQNYLALTGATVTLNSWNHIAIVRSGSTITGYINGVAAGTVTYSGIFGNSSTNLEIGATTRTGSAAQFAYGYISNIRVVKGTAVYTGAFTPPTAPLTAITNTSLLTCQSATFIDNSTNNFTITAATTTVKPTTYNPFTVTYSTLQSYTPSVFGGSMYFDGTGDFLTLGTAWSLLGTGNFTIECWINIASNSVIQIIADARGIQNAVPWQMYTSASGKLVFANGATILATGATTILPGVWTHVAIARSGSTITLYVNGLSDATASNSSNLSGSGTTYIGRTFDTSGTLYYNGYISDFRTVIGTAIYTSNFVPQNAPLTAVRNTSLLVNGTSAGIYDSSENANFETLGDAKLSTTTVKFSGTTSMYFDGTGDYLLTPNNINLKFGSGDFTIELWAYFAVSTSATDYTFVMQGTNAFTSDAGYSFARHNSNKLRFVFTDDGTGVSGYKIIDSTANFTPTINTWYHLAITRSGSTFRLFIDGTVVGSGTYSQSIYNSTRAIGVAASSAGEGVFNGYISDLRITKGVARYTANFTAPTSPFAAK